MTHGDDTGLMLPPKMAPIQVVIVPIWKKTDEKALVPDAVSSVAKILKTAGLEVKVDDSEQRTPGWKFNFWEMKGVPLRIEIGPRDVSNGTVSYLGEMFLESKEKFLGCPWNLQFCRPK
ncbi:proline--tRNA ligase, chloroplastic/mitochondrial-like [Magnolia sinica]|uniref:proline--tRNA ligase, chloroplastic/mitochondrial-like n=1 Tax=Magnolia sinica TaxID=86752 RepID=UPI0026592D4E|nr:proline--tRNA ligase, chloroplastic/mitochondrial-like [Magnolia sinica]